MLARTLNKIGKLDPQKDYFEQAIRNVNILMDQLPEDILNLEPTDARLSQTQETVRKALFEKAKAHLSLAQKHHGAKRELHIQEALKTLNDLIRCGGKMREKAEALKRQSTSILKRNEK